MTNQSKIAIVAITVVMAIEARTLNEFAALIDRCRRFNTQEPLGVKELEEVFPYLLRLIPSLSEVPEEIHVAPQSGEYDRYGVFFYALPGRDSLDKFKTQGRFPILLKTKDVFNGSGVDKELVSKGVVLTPSEYYKKLYDCAREEILKQNPLQNSGSIGFYCEAGRQITENNVVLDYRVVREGIFPILSIPSDLKIAKQALIGFGK